ncbi:unnamed protein product [Brachionus calyciflorus]|uniref:RING-type domain-containing protein n=1 Tax=Brachionus calyciflorus TaxID=104777 RepID=A0A813UP85_9BILA|nr:unnamed protein product [Brachionus calyciflorus]
MECDNFSPNCPYCKKELKSPRVLPCGETICLNCILNNIKEMCIECPFCNEKHIVPSNFFPINKYAQNMIETYNSKFYRGPVFEQFKNSICTIDKLLESCSFDFNSAKRQIQDYCEQVIKQIDFDIHKKIEPFQKQIQSLQKTQEILCNEVKKYEKEWLSELDANKENLIQFHTSHMKTREEIKETKKILKNLKFEETNLKEKILRVKSLEWKVKTNRKKFKNFIFNNQELILNNSENLYRLVKVDTSILKLKNYTKIKLSNFLGARPDRQILVDKLNENLIFNFVDINNNFCFEVRDFKNLNQIHKSLVNNNKKNVINSIMKTTRNKIVFYEETYDWKTLKIFDENLNLIKEVLCNNLYWCMCATEYGIFAAENNFLLCDFSRIHVFDWSLRLINCIRPNSSLYSYPSSIDMMFSNQDYLFFVKENTVFIVSARDGRKIGEFVNRGDLEFVNENFLIFKHSKRFEFYDPNGNFVENVKINGCLSNYSKILMNDDRNFLFLDEINNFIYVPGH